MSQIAGRLARLSMLDFLKRLRAGTERRPTTVHAAVGAGLVAHGKLPAGLVAENAMLAAIQIDGDPAPGRGAVPATAASSPRDVFLVPGGLGLPALALVNVRDPHARIALWTLDSPTPGPASIFADRRELRHPAGRQSPGWQVSQVALLPRLQCLVVLRHDDEARTALVAVLDLASGDLRELGTAEPDPFVDGAGHVAALRAAADSVLVRWHSGRVKLGRWGDVAIENRIVLFTPRERAGLQLLTLGLDDGNVRAWGMAGATLWLMAIDARLDPMPRQLTWSLDLARML